MFKILKKDPLSRARLGILETPHGTVHTPSYVIVGTHGKVRTLSNEELVSAKTQLIIVNTYHMWLSLGAGLESFPGLHSAMNWQNPLMTDSGGFQAFSLGAGRTAGVGKIIGKGKSAEPENKQEKSLVRVTEDGVYFSDQEKEYFLDAEKSISIQQKLGADIILAFDEPSSPLHDYDYTKAAMERTHRWAVRSLKAKTSSQILYGIVQGGAFEDLRKESANFISGLAFDGIAIGGAFGSSFGDTKEKTFQELAWISPILPEEKPRHLLGIGRIEDVFAGIEQGMDTFDCVIPTREARHGSIWTKRGRFDIKRGAMKDSKKMIDPECSCPVCSEMQIEKGDLYALFKERNQRAGALASLHNVFFFNNLMEEIRQAIAGGKFAELKKKYLSF